MTIHETTHGNTTASASTTELRPLGSFENLFDLYTQRFPVQFSVIARVDRAVGIEQLTAALRQVQLAHPMLTVGVHRDASGAHFRRSDRPVPIVEAAPETAWETIATHDQSQPLDVTDAPLARCTVSTSGASSVIIMTFAHQIADGLSGTAVLRDVVRALNGATLPARSFPPAQEELLAAAAASASDTEGDGNGMPAAESGSASDDSGEIALSRRGNVRPFDSAPPHIQSLTWSAALTTRARTAAREHSTTLHGLVTAAAVRVLFAATQRESLALMNPMDIRRAASADETLALYFLSTRMGFTPDHAADIWALAHDVRSRIRSAQSLPALAGAAAGMSAGTSWVTNVDDAVEAMVSFANYDLMVTNLGDLDARAGSAAEAGAESAPATMEADAAQTHIVDLFGPTMSTQIEDEQILALSTFGGALRTTITTRTPVRDYLERIRAEVEAALGDPA